MFALARKRALAALVHLFAAVVPVICVAQPSAPSAAVPPVLKLAFVYVGPVSDGGWTYAHDRARKTVQAEFGERVVTTFVENVPEGPEAEKVFRDLAIQGNQVIFGTTFGYMDSMHKVAKESPHVKFEHATGHRIADNVAVYEARTYEAAYLAGLVAGKVSNTGKLGFVASIPIPEVIRNINAFTLGARSVNPAATTQVAWIHKWVDPAREREAALGLIRQGVDVLMQNTDSSAVLRTAQEKGVHAFGWDSDMKQYGPRAHLGSAIIDGSPYYKKVVTDVMHGKWQSGAVWWGARQNVARIASPNPALGQEVLLFLGEKTHALKSGRLNPFQGPIADRAGNEVVAPGSVMGDARLKSMDFYVRGVEGEMPK